MRRICGMLVLISLALATTARAAPVQRTVNATLSLTIQGLNSLAVTGTGTVTVDTAAGTIAIPAGLVQLTAKVVVPVTTSTAITSLSAKVISNQAGTLSLGGATAQLPNEICPLGLPACVVGGGTGGAMGLQGTVSVVVIPNVLHLPFDLNAMRIGKGGSTNVPFTLDAAAWTNGQGVVQTSSGTRTLTGSGTIGAASVTFVTPSRVLALGNALPIDASLSLDFVPEPGTLLLLGLGALGIGVLVRRR